jgi:hypothetical protein
MERASSMGAMEEPLFKAELAYHILDFLDSFYSVHGDKKDVLGQARESSGHESKTHTKNTVMSRIASSASLAVNITTKGLV